MRSEPDQQAGRSTSIMMASGANINVFTNKTKMKKTPQKVKQKQDAGGVPYPALEPVVFLQHSLHRCCQQDECASP